MDFALLQVGINSYPSATLRGCVNDCENLLRHFDAIKRPPIRRLALYDEAATRQNILDHLQWLLRVPAPLLVFQYSGHGARVRDRNGDEPDKYDSAICPVDFWDTGLILDDELGELYSSVDQSKRLVVLSDSCHSGQSQRAITLKAKALFRMDIPRFIHEDQIPTKAAALARPVAGIKLTTRKAFLETNERAVLISTSKETQTSADAYVDKAWQGAGTASLLWAWKELGINANYWDVARVANTWLKKNSYSQVLRVEGQSETKGRPLFT